MKIKIENDFADRRTAPASRRYITTIGPAPVDPSVATGRLKRTRVTSYAKDVAYSTLVIEHIDRLPDPDVFREHVRRGCGLPADQVDVTFQRLDGAPRPVRCLSSSMVGARKVMLA